MQCNIADCFTKESVGFFMPILYIASFEKGLAIKFFEEGGNYMTKCKVIALANQKGDLITLGWTDADDG